MTNRTDDRRRQARPDVVKMLAAMEPHEAAEWCAQRLAERRHAPAEPIDVRPLILTAAEVAPMLGVTERTVHRWIQQGAFPCPEAVRVIQGRVRFSRPALEEWAKGS